MILVPQTLGKLARVLYVWDPGILPGTVALID
jgi:hypothetical protein